MSSPKLTPKSKLPPSINTAESSDASDASLDSAVFIEAGSFDLGVNLGDDILVENGNAECIGGEIILDTQVEQEDASFIWYLDGAEISDENSSTLTVTENGLYSVDVTISEDCSTGDEILIEFYTPEIVEDLPQLDACDNFAVDGDGIFDLTIQSENILSCLLYTSPSPRDATLSRMPSSA